jgi:hypothetical protein
VIKAHLYMVGNVLLIAWIPNDGNSLRNTQDLFHINAADFPKIIPLKG